MNISRSNGKFPIRGEVGFKKFQMVAGYVYFGGKWATPSMDVALGMVRKQGYGPYAPPRAHRIPKLRFLSVGK
jgi:hypothetical protein